MEQKEIILLIFILLISAFFRLWKLDKIPPGLYPDEAINGNEAIFFPGKLFYPENYGREGLFINLISLSFSIFGISIWSIRIVAAIIGILTVFGTYLLSRELFSERSSISLLSSFFLAISFWHTNFSRIGFRAILLPFVLVFGFYFLLKGLKRKKTFDFIISGIFFGLGFYTYISYRFIVILLPLILIPWFFIYKRGDFQKIFFLNVLYLALTIFFIAFPTGIYFLKNPQDFISRAAPITIFKAENPIKEFLKSLILHLGMFNFYGDPNWRHNFSGKPQLFWPIGILFLIGILFSIKELFNAKEVKNFSSLAAYCLLLSWFFIMLLPGILTREGIPHSLRVIGVIPVVYVFVGMGDLWLHEKFKKIIKNEKLLFLACFLFFVAIAFFEFNKYFFIWAKRSEVKSEFTSEYLEMGNYLNSLSQEFEKYVIVNRAGVPVSWIGKIPMPAQSIIFLEMSKYKKIQSNFLLPEDLEKIKIEKKGIILPMAFGERIFNQLKEKFPQGEMKKINDFWVYEVRK